MNPLLVDASESPVPEYEYGETPAISMEVLNDALGKINDLEDSSDPEVAKLAEGVSALGRQIMQLANGLRWGEIRVVESYDVPTPDTE